MCGGHGECAHRWEHTPFKGVFDRGDQCSRGVDDLDCVQVWQGGESVDESWEDDFSLVNSKGCLPSRFWHEQANINLSLRRHESSIAVTHRTWGSRCLLFTKPLHFLSSLFPPSQETCSRRHCPSYTSPTSPKPATNIFGATPCTFMIMLLKTQPAHGRQAAKPVTIPEYRPWVWSES